MDSKGLDKQLRHRTFDKQYLRATRPFKDEGEYKQIKLRPIVG